MHVPNRGNIAAVSENVRSFCILLWLEKFTQFNSRFDCLERIVDRWRHWDLTKNECRTVITVNRERYMRKITDCF